MCRTRREGRGNAFGGEGAGQADRVEVPGTLQDWLTDPEASVVRAAWRAIRAGQSPIFITGAAGTGKSLLLRLIAAELDDVAVLAPTGVAALKVDAQTIHSFFRLAKGIQVPGDDDTRRPLDLYRALSAVIIDEISMVRADTLDKIDWILRQARGTELPYGGVQVIMVGDLFQLPPVVPRTELPLLTRMGYEGPFFFSSFTNHRSPARVFILDRIHRQRDRRFVATLNAIRIGQVAPDTLRWLNCRVVREALVEEVGSLVLTTRRLEAQVRNEQHLNALPGPETVYVGSVQGSFRPREFPAPMQLRLRPGARVMFAKNDAEGRWVNGTTGVVLRCHAGYVVVDRGDGGPACEVRRVPWEKHVVEYDPLTHGMRRRMVGRFVQIPLVLGWAATIHRAQSLTLDRVHVDLSRRGAFCAGQTYVALSRSRTPQGLTLARPVHLQDVIVDARVVDFLRDQGVRLAA